MHDMKYELPPQKKWPHGVHPPGNPSAITTPTMEKLAAQGTPPVEQNEVCFASPMGSNGDSTYITTQTVPPFNLEELLDTKPQ